ncbi:hypothetical protein CQW23_33276 [Capsicum baccatum]|uniref:Protein TAR1 n=1 Tax=Capsicum baccatum TaxID=33114 RepID=A0A2G2V2B1_CAPBA|nr:hypothetical protein CQW23_33276 [Capsicum baccatum]
MATPPGLAPKVCSHSNPSQKIKVDRRCTPRGDPTHQLRCALRVYSPVDSHTCQNPWFVFDDGSNGEPTGQRSERADAEARQRRALPSTIEETAFHERIESPGFGRPLIHAGPRPESIGGPAHCRSTSFSGRIAGPHPLPSQQFQALFDSLFKVLFIFPSRRALGLMASGATCVQRLDGSRDSAIHTKYRISLHSSSMREPRYPLPRVFFIYRRSTGFDNDPSAASPTETLLRLVLPLNDKVQWTSRDVASSEPPTSPRSEHFTGSFNR